MTSLAANDDRAVLGDEEAASLPPSFESRSSAAAVPNRRRPVAALLASLALALAVAALHRHGRQPAVASLPEDPAVVDAPPADAPTAHDDASSNANSHFVEAPRTVDYSPADMTQWSPFPATSPEEHTLGYPFVAACITRTDEARSVALAMTGALDVMDAFPSEDEAEDNLFGQVAKTWTYVFLVHDAEDFAHLLRFGLPYVPDLIMTRDLQDSRIGIHHPHDEDSPGRRRLAKPACDDGRCRQSYCSACCPGDLCDAYEQNCGECPEAPEPPEVYEGVGECAVVTPVDYNALFTAGVTGTYEGISSYTCYRTVDGTNATIDDLVAAYPTLAEKIVLDQYPTVGGEYLYVLKLTNTNFDPSAVGDGSYGDKGKVFATCSIHSREFTPGETCTRFAEYLLQNYDTDPDVHWILNWNEIHLIPTGNPDGRRYDEINKASWRKNRNKPSSCTGSSVGIDLNRNFPFKWNQCAGSGCSSSSCADNTYRGESKESEQETKAILEYARTIFPVGQRPGDGSLGAAEIAAGGDTASGAAFSEANTGVFMDVHSSGGDIGFPWGYKEVRSGNDAGLGALGRKMASYNQYRLWAPEMPNFGYPTDGDTLDTFYGWLGVAAILWELGTSFYQSCTYFEDTIINQVFPGMLYAAKVAKSPFITSKGPDILCLSLAAESAPVGSTLVAAVDASDSVRAKHADDGNTLFATGNQGVETIEVYVGCHPNEGATCPINATKTFAAPEPTVTGVEITFDVPATAGTHTIYVRAVDNEGYPGPVTARSFVATACTGGCTEPPTKSPTASPTTVPTPSVTGPGPGPTCESQGPVGCKVGERCNGKCTECCCGFNGGGNSKKCNTA